MKKKQAWKRIAAWMMTAAMLTGSNSFVVLAQEMDEASAQESVLEAAVQEAAAEAAVQEAAAEAAVPVMQEAAPEPAAEDAAAEEPAVQIGEEAQAETQAVPEDTAEPDGAAEENAAEAAIPAEPAENEDLFIDSVEFAEDALLYEEEETVLSDNLFEDGNYDVWFDGLREDGQTWNYVDEDIYYALNKDNLAGLDQEQLSYSYEYGYWDWEKECIAPIEADLEEYLTEDGISIPASVVPGLREQVISASGDPNGNAWLEVRVTVQYQGNEISRDSVSIELRQVVYEYNYPQIRRGELLPGWDEYLGSDFSCWVEDGAHPDGEEVPVHIDDIKVEDKEGSENVLTYRRNGENGWDFHANREGVATVTIYYTPVEGSGDPGEYSFDVYVGGRVTDFDIDTPTHTNMVLPGQEIELSAFMTRYNHEGEMEFLPGNLDGHLRLEWGIDWGGENVESFAQDENDPGIFRVQTAKRDYEYSFLVWVRAYENGEDEECAYAEYEVYVPRGYLLIEPSDLERTELHIGESVTVRPELLQYEINDESPDGTYYPVKEFQEEDGAYPVAARWEYDENMVKITGNEDGSYTITKLQNGYTDMYLSMGIERSDDQGETRFEGRCGRNYSLDEMNYDVWFDDFKEDGWTWNYVDEDIFYTLNKDNLEGLDPNQLNYIYEYGYWDEESDGIAPIGADLEQYLTEDGISIPANVASGLREQIIEASGDRTDSLHLEVAVQYQGNEISRDSVSIELRQVVYEYNYPQIRRGELLPGWDEYLDSYFSCWVKDGAHPDGEEVPVHIDDIKVEDKEDSEGSENVLTYEWNGENGWDFHANREGGATVTIYYTPVEGSGDPGEYSFDVWVGGRVTDFDIDTPTHMNMVLPGKEIELRAFMTRYNQEGEMEFLPGNLDERLRLEWGIDWGGENVESFAQDEKDPGIFRVQTAKRDYEYSFLVWVRAYEEDENGEEVECGYADYVVDAVPDYFLIEPTEVAADDPMAKPLINESLHIADLQPELWYYRTDEEPRQWDEVRYKLDYYDENAWSITEGALGVEEPVPAEELPRLLRKTTWGTDINLCAYINVAEEGMEEEWQNVAGGWYHFDDISDCYQTDFLYSYGERMDEVNEDEPVVSRVLTDIPLVLSLDTAQLHGIEKLEGFKVEWNLWQDHDGNAGEVTCADWEIAEDRLSVTMTGLEGHIGEWVDVEALIICNDSIVASVWTHAMVDTCEHEWSLEKQEPSNCTENGHRIFRCKHCGAARTEVIPALGHKFSTSFTTDRPATCTKKGSRSKHCIRCDAKTAVTEIPMIAHKGGTATCFEQAKCQVCGQRYGSKLKAKLEVPTKNLPLKTGQKLTTFKVTMAKGDSVVSWKSSNTKIVKVTGKKNGTCTLNAGKKTGTAKITIKLKSKKSVTIKVTVQKDKVKTKKISVSQKKINLKKGGKLKLEPVITPISSSEKVTYSSSNKNVAAVSAKGEIKAKKKGKTEITIKSGKKKIKCEVTVK